MKKVMRGIGTILVPLILQGCATPTLTPSLDSPPIPRQKANLEAVLEEHEGLEVVWEDAKELRDFYRGGVQQKAKAEKEYQEKAYREALKLYDNSSEFFLFVLKHDNQDAADYPLFEGASILFFPNLLLADNYLKSGRVLWEMGRESSAKRKWKQALPYLTQSMRSEPTEWGISLQRELAASLDSPKR